MLGLLPLQISPPPQAMHGLNKLGKQRRYSDILQKRIRLPTIRSPDLSIRHSPICSVRGSPNAKTSMTLVTCGVKTAQDCINKKESRSVKQLLDTGLLINNYPAKLRGISPDTQPTRPQAELAKIRRYSARFRRIIVLLFNKLITQLKKNILPLLFQELT